MAIEVITDGYLVVNGVNLSSRVRSMVVNQEFDDLESSAMTQTKHQHQVGPGDDSIEVEFWQDSAAGSVDQTLSPLVGSDTGFSIEVRRTSAAVATTNPKWTGTAKIFAYQPLNAKWGELSSTNVPFKTLRPTRAT